uniref:Ethanolamine utilization protein EutN n=1 Tax=Schlesneria paludicola TaxID=360056 RepID=A0A7C4QSB4_9PLAN
MQLATVIGRATATIKHPTLQGWRLLLVQPLLANGQSDGAPQLVLDHLGARKGDMVIVSSDGKSARELVGTEKTCARWTILGIVDEHALFTGAERGLPRNHRP